MESMPRPFTPRTLAERWNCSHQHVRNLINRGKLPAFYLGKLIGSARPTSNDLRRV